MSTEPVEPLDEGDTVAPTMGATPRHLHPVDTGPTTDHQDEEHQDQVLLDEDSGGDRLAAVYAFLAEAFTPASGLYRDRQPAPKEVLDRAKHGQHLPEVGAARTAAQAYGYAAAANRMVASTWCWIVDHPARVAVVTALLAVALAWEPTRVAAGWALAPFSWAHTALT